MKLWELHEPGIEIATYFKELREHADDMTALAITALAFKKTPAEIFESVSRTIINESKS